MADESDFNEQLLRRLDAIDSNTFNIAKTSSANNATLNAVQEEFRSYRRTLHDRFNAINEKLADLEISKEDQALKIVEMEFKVNLIYKVLAGIGAVAIAAITLLSDTMHHFFQYLFNVKP